MKILHLSSYDFGGAANAAIRLHEGLLAAGLESRFACKTVSQVRNGIVPVLKEKGDLLKKSATRIDFHLARLLHPGVRPVLPFPRMSGGGMRALDRYVPDLINLHWVEHNFITPADLRKLVARRIPMVWTLHDMAPLSGGFSYREAGGLPPAALGPLCCPGSRLRQSSRILAERTRALAGADLTIVSPSRWLAAEAAHSPVFERFPVHVIPYGIDTDVFRPLDKMDSRDRWDVPRNAKVILFGADTFDDPRKGISHLQAALESLSSQIPDLVVLGFGNRDFISDHFPGIETRSAGRVRDLTELASLYSAADVFVCPSREDNLPNTVIESLCCGTPVAGFEVGGLPDLVEQGRTGYLAPCYEPDELGAAIHRIIAAGTEEGGDLRNNCRKFAMDSLGLSGQAEAYHRLYKEILDRQIN